MVLDKSIGKVTRFKRKLFEKNEGYCDRCNKEISKSKLGYGLRHRYIPNEVTGGFNTKHEINLSNEKILVMCSNCYSSLYRNPKHKFRVNRTPEEKRLRKLAQIKAHYHKYADIKKQRTEYVRLLPPEELLKKVRKQMKVEELIKNGKPIRNGNKTRLQKNTSKNK